MLYRPFSLERRIYRSEVRLLGGLLRSPRRLPHFAARLHPLHFYDYRHQLIWAAILSLHRRGESVSAETVLAELASDDRDDDAGGRRYLTWLAQQYAGKSDRTSSNCLKAAPGASKVGHTG